ncbi:hypothetical protein MMA231_02489 [Asticcacaulis sp. MM231]|uniref:phage tail protein I n=1 Tax=Asticcacaulis sp. MM231 TaxID=3157666 RepID=UPI0032D567C1
MMSVLPPNASHLERALEAAIQTPALPVPIRDLWSPDRCPVQYLPWLARALSIDTLVARLAGIGQARAHPAGLLHPAS